MTVNVTFSVDEQTLDQAREVARNLGKSLNALIREYLEDLSGRKRQSDVLDEMRRQWDEGLGRSGERFNRDATYGERLGRPRLP
jgi:hypothetical protein